MPFIPHTDADVAAMLSTINVNTLEQLFDEIPNHLRSKPLDKVGPGLTEMACHRMMQDRAKQDRDVLNFIGAGAYEHHIPAAVWDIATRGEFMTAYTPYQAEASQGTLQVIYEYQTMITRLMAMDVSNASMYEGATALVEACLMALRLNKKAAATKILCAGSLHPYYQKTLNTILTLQGFEVVTWPLNPTTGTLDLTQAGAFEKDAYAALIIPQPNFLGCLEDVHTLTNWAHAHNLFAIGVVNPVAMALTSPPGEWGDAGVDIACGEGQPLGVPLNSGGPYFGFLCCRKAYVRQMPGRIVGRTIDQNNQVGYTLTLQAREQHIRRAKATSNICTNQGLAVTAATIYMSLLGETGFTAVATAAYQNTHLLSDKLCALDGVSPLFTAPYFHEVAIQLPCDASLVIEKLAQKRINAGFDLSEFDPAFKQGLLVCATETKTADDIDTFVHALQEALTL